jgi:glycosyltransferase involved in cell wall biosynthesis
MKIAIVCTYFDRLSQLRQTIASLNKYKRNDFELIIVDDNSPNEIGPLDNNFPVEIIRLINKSWVNSCIPYNTGFNAAMEHSPDIIIIQNAETYHEGDILGYAERGLRRNNYITFPCYSLSKDDTLPPAVMNNRCATFDGDSAWYNHSVHRPLGYHFCAAILADNLRKINGFDERFINGSDWEDNYLLHQIRTLGLKIEIPPAPYVFHQWHYSSPRPKGTADNGALYTKLIKDKNYRAVHTITPDL